MADRLDDFDFDAEPPRKVSPYPIDVWMDGAICRIWQGEDFEGPLRSMRTRLHYYAKSAQLSVRTRQGPRRRPRRACLPVLGPRLHPPTEMTGDRLLAPEDVARRVGLSRRAVYDAIRRGELPAMRLCGRLRIRPEDLDAWMVAATVAPPIPLPSVPEVRKRLTRTPAAGSFRALMAEGGGLGGEAA